ncbi:zinc-dependent alcohol dehydrogenase family protein [Pseudomonas sp. NY15354]|uniref:zinc-dependent alcohol dehydrogenase family protein n=1 Tax=Pseudomonas sp. NY15354 TaxID=3400351 RepID=UPI003A854696
MSKPTMRALLLESYQSAQFRDVQIERPAPGQGEVLVRVIASGVNPIDYKIRTGIASYAMPELPAVLGTDMAGIVESVGAGVTTFKPGDAVYGMTGGVRGLQGSLAHYQVADADLLAHKPKNLSFREAAAVPLTFLTAWQGLVDGAKLKQGQSVLIQGGAGGVGHMAVQIARSLGANVFATASQAKHSLVEQLGAVPIDYHSSTVEQYISRHTQARGFEVIFDSAGGKSLDDSLAAIAPYGHIASCAAFGTHNLATSSLRCATLTGVFVLLPMLSGQGRAHQGQVLANATRLIEKGEVRPILDKHRFTLSEAHQAHDLVQSGQAVGKVVIEVASEADQWLGAD